MEKFYQGWVESDDGSMGMVADAETIGECEKRTLEIVQQCGQRYRPKAVVLYVCAVSPVRKLSVEPEWTDV